MYYNQLLKKTAGRWMLAAALLPLVVAGCSRSVGVVSGKVMFKDQSVPAGSVTFVHENGTTASGAIQDGNYSIPKVPAGQCTVLVVSAPPPRGMWNPQTKEMVGGGDASSKIRKAVSIPARYGDPKKSDLQCEVTGGSQTFNIDMKP